MRFRVWRLVRLCLFFVIGFCVAIMLLENGFIYFPSKYPEGDWHPREARDRGGGVRAPVEDCFFEASDGVKLHGWYCTPLDGGRRECEAVLLWFHGNAGNITHRYDTIRQMVRFPAHVFIFDYRGYGRSEGRPTEAGVYLDGQAAWDYLVRDRGIEPGRLILFGRSLGGAVAIELARRRGNRPGGLIVESSFTSVPDMAANVMPIVPRILIRTRMDSINKIGSIDLPKLFVHSRADDIIPFEHGRRLFAAAGEPKQFYELANAGHNETEIEGGAAYFNTLRAFIRSCSATGENPSAPPEGP